MIANILSTKYHVRGPPLKYVMNSRRIMKYPIVIIST